MASLKATADSIRDSISSTATCTPATVTSLSDLLLPKPSVPKTSAPLNSKKSTKSNSATTLKPKVGIAKCQAKKVGQENIQVDVDQLSPKERSILATEVINATLKSLTEAIKAPTQTVRKQASSKDPVKATVRKNLRRSNSLPQSPLQPRSLNRVASFPNIASRQSRSSSSASSSVCGYKAAGECARVAFACLRTLQASKCPDVAFPPLQLENGMSVLIGKLLLLGLDDLAIKEVRALKKRLDPDVAQKRPSAPKSAAAATPQTLSELLDFGTAQYSGAKLSLVIATQLQILRLLVSTRKHSQAEAALPLLKPEHPSSPTRLLQLASGEIRDRKEMDKIARQFQSLSDILLSLCPSVSSSDDDVAKEPRLSICPEVAIQIQSIGLQNRAIWWKIAGHKEEASKKQLWIPLQCCLSAFSRRSTCAAIETYQISSTVYQNLHAVFLECKVIPVEGTGSSLPSIYRVLGSLAKDAGMFAEAINWTERFQASLDIKTDSEVRRCSVVARLVSLKLKKSTRDPNEEELLLSLLEGLEQPFKGEASEIDDLIAEVSYARRAAIAILGKARASSSGFSISQGLRDMCESLIFLCPRLSLRYLGNTPDAKSATKDVVRHDQRRQLITISALHSIDSVLFLIRVLAAEERLNWDLMDSKLQDCLLLHDRLDISSRDVVMEDGNPPPAYYVRISNVYYSQFLTMRRISNNAKDGQQFRALRRAVDSMRGRPQHEKRAASLWTKLERLAEFCKQAGRYDELLKTLTSLRNELIEQGALTLVAKSAASQSLSSAWMQNDETSALSRTMQSMIKVETRYLKTSSLATIVEPSWSNEERAVVLENQQEMLSSQSSSVGSDLPIQIFQQLLDIYDGAYHPFRRLRVLFQLFCLELEQETEVVDDLSAELKLYCQDDAVFEGTRDEGLRNYFTNLKTFAATSLELRKEKPDLDVLKQCLSTWSSIRENCRNVEDLEAQVENVAALLAHLRSISNYLEMKGHDTVRLATLRLIADFSQILDVSSNADALVVSFSALGSQWLQLGYSGKAGMVFDKAKDYNRQNGVSLNTSLQLHLSYSKYLLAIGNTEKCEEQLALAKGLFSQNQDPSVRSRVATTAEQRTRRYVLVSNAYLIHSMLALERGAAQLALDHAKMAIRLLRRAWVYTEDQPIPRTSTSDSSALEETGHATEESSQVAGSERMITFPVNKGSTTTVCGPRFWSLISPLFSALNHAGSLYAHHGMFQETIYYTQEAHKLVMAVGSEAHLAIASALLGSTYLKGGALEKGSEHLMAAKQYSSMLSNCTTRGSAVLLYQTGAMQGLLGDHDAEISSYKEAEEVLKKLTSMDHIINLDMIKEPSASLEEKMAKLTIAKPKTAVSRKAPVRTKATTNRKTTTRPKSPVEVTLVVTEKFPQLDSLKGSLLRQKARVFISLKRSADAFSFLHEAGELSGTQAEAIEQSVTMARQLLLQSMEQMAADPVYSVLQESTLSFPSVAGIAKPEKAGERLSVVKASPPRKNVKNSRALARSKSPSPDGCFDKLRQAQEHLIDVHSIAVSVAPVSVIHSIATLLNSVSILQAACWQAKGRNIAHPGFSSCSIETARTLALRRERRVVQAESIIPLKADSNCWPSLPSSDARRSSIGSSNDMTRFQQNYIDIIPKSWTAISISLSDSRDELSITKFQAGHSPFILRLPLARHNSMDPDEEVFGFQQGQAELLEIIQLANESAHDARDVSGKDSKAAWWEKRETLDARLRDLLENIEKVWLGGFTGIFSQHARRADLLARFQKSFQNILDKYLPSRRKTGKRGTTQRIALDSRILELFVGLGDASDENCDFSEPLTDLLNFVVDVLQFHGELNAYSEIDFDSIVIETHDALRGYHSALNSSSQTDEGRHTILILDKALHAFPWESLPCMEGLAVSRLPSLGCLRDQILRQQNNMPEDAPEGQYIDRSNGAFVLNPSGDLKNTQATFTKGLQSLSWNGVVRRAPTEDEIKSALLTKDLYLYFGHGSGAQYIRAKEIRKLDKCAVSWLMGCSSGALTEAGEFEPYGPAINYMHAGCPALVATLWDVTDKDIDRFAKSAFEHWGLFEKEVPGKGKGKRKLEVVEEEARVYSLVEAVAKGREACNLKYLNAAAVCVYGVPVYFS